MASGVKSIRSIPVEIDPKLREILEAMKQRLEVLFGERDAASGGKYSSQADMSSSIDRINESLLEKANSVHAHADVYDTKEEVREKLNFSKLGDVKIDLTDNPGRMIFVPPDAEAVKCSSRYREDADGTLRIGNVDAGSCLQIEPDGTTVFEGDAIPWGEISHGVRSTDNPAWGAAVPVATVPTWVKIIDDGAASVGVYGAHFANTQEVWVNFVMPPTWKEGTTIYPVLYWMPTTDVSPADNVGIGLEYSWVGAGGAVPASVLLERDISTGINQAYIPQASKFSDTGIDGTGKEIGSLLLCRLYRLAAVADDYADLVVFVTLGIRYEMDTVGGRTVDSK